MRFEYDPVKSTANKIKHGVDFVEAQGFWQGPTAMVSTMHRGENRRLVIGKLSNKHWAAIITLRGKSIRNISVRKARENEKQIYQKHLG